MKTLLEKFCMWYLTRQGYRVIQPAERIPAFIREMRGAK